MRVAQIIESLTMGGAETLAVNIANSLAARGHASHLIVLKGPDILSSRLSSGVHVHYLNYERGSLRNPFTFVARLPRGRRLLARTLREADVSVAQTHLPGANFWGLVLELTRVCPVLATIHNNQEFRYGDVDNPVLAFLRKRAYRMILERGHGAIAVSDEVRTSLLRDLGVSGPASERVHVVTNAVQIPPALSPDRIAEIRGELGVPAGALFILAAGRFCEQKNFGNLVTAASRLRERDVAFRLVIGGDGDERPALLKRVAEAQLESCVSLPGNLVGLGEKMQAADIFTMSSLWEGLPLVLLEAMAAGRPSVVTSIPGIVEVVTDGVTGRLVPVNDPDVLAAGLEELAGDPERRRALGEAAAAHIACAFDFERLISELEEIYRRTVTP